MIDTLNEYTFYYSSKLISTSLPSEIQIDTFYGCINLYNVTIPEKTSKISF